MANDQMMVDFYLRENCKGMTVRELAEACGIPRSTVSRRLKKLGLKTRGGGGDGKQDGKGGTSGTRSAGKAAAEPTGMERLVELRDMLHAQLLEANASSIARISSEYRAVLSDIEALSAPDDDEAYGFEGYE